MELKQLRYFLAVCDNGSFSSAADSMYISQQGISMSILRLENELGTKLFNRTSKSISLTDDGKYLERTARYIIYLSNGCLEHFNQFHFRSSVIHVATSVAAVGILPLPLLTILQNPNPDYRVELHYGLGLASEELIDLGTCSMGFICGPIDLEKYNARLLGSQEYTYLVNHSHPLAQKDELKLADLGGCRLLMPGAKSKVFRQFSDICVQRGVLVNFQSSVTSSTYSNQNLIYQLVKKDPTCIGQVLSSFSDSMSDPDIKVLRITDIDMPWELYLTWSRRNPLRLNEKEFAKLVIESFAKSDIGQLL